MPRVALTRLQAQPLRLINDSFMAVFDPTLCQPGTEELVVLVSGRRLPQRELFCCVGWRSSTAREFDRGARQGGRGIFLSSRSVSLTVYVR